MPKLKKLIFEDEEKKKDAFSKIKETFEEVKARSQSDWEKLKFRVRGELT